MATSAATLIQRTRRLLRDWPELDTASASIASNGSSLTLASTTGYSVNWLLELDQELVRVTALTDATHLALQRGLRGSTAASHASSSTVLVNPAFYSIEILDALNEAMDACFPSLYRPVSDTSLTPNGTLYEFAVPATDFGVAIPYLDRIEVKESGDLAYRLETAWEVRRDEAPFIKFRRPPNSGATIRLHGYGPFSHLTTTASTLDTYFPLHAEGLLPLFAASHLLSSGEAGRVRWDVGATDQREQANRSGSSMVASDRLLTRFYKRLSDAAMQPLSPHLVSLF